MYKLNTDISKMAERVTRDGVLRDSNGNFNFAFYTEFSDYDDLCAEGLSLLVDLELCDSNNSMICWLKLILLSSLT